MAISRDLMQELVTFFEQRSNDKAYYQHKLKYLFNESESIVNDINWDTALSKIIPIILEKLDRYGKSEGEIALCGFLKLIAPKSNKVLSSGMLIRPYQKGGLL